MTTGATRDAALIALATEAYRRRHGSMPQRLEDLVPGFLPTLPPDPWADAPLRARFSENGVTVYSVAGNGADDLGRPELETIIQAPVRGIYTDIDPKDTRQSIDPAAKLRTVERQVHHSSLYRRSRRDNELSTIDWVIWPQPRRIIDSPSPTPAPLPPR